MVWRKRGEVQGSWIGPMQVVIQESHQVIWVTRQSKLYRVAPEHVRSLTAVEENESKERRSQEKGLQHTPIVQGVTQYIDLTRDRSPPGVENTRNPPEIEPLTSNDHRETTGVMENPSNEHPENTASPREDRVAQPDDEPSAPSIGAPHSASLPEPAPVDVPVPISDDEIASTVLPINVGNLKLK